MIDAVLRKAYVALLVCSAAFAGSVLAAPRAALVIGNASYAHAPALANPLNDAADVGAALERLGFKVTRLENAGYAELRRGLQEFALAASASEVAVVFYAGHGIEVDRRNFLVPVDARLASDQDVEFEAVPLELVSRAVERASGLRLVILDACRENPFAVSMQRAGATRSIGRGLARVEPSGETLVAYAAKEGTVAADGAGRNSPYSEALLAQLEEPGLEVGLMFRRVRDAVLAVTGGRQEPFVYGSLSSRGVYLAAKPAPSPVTGAVTGASAPDSPGSHRITAERELLFWESVKDSRDPSDIRLYLERYSGGTYEALAHNRLKRLEGLAKSTGPSVSTPKAPSKSAREGEMRLTVEREFWALVKEERGTEVTSRHTWSTTRTVSMPRSRAFGWRSSSAGARRRRRLRASRMSPHRKILPMRSLLRPLRSLCRRPRSWNRRWGSSARSVAGSRRGWHRWGMGRDRRTGCSGRRPGRRFTGIRLRRGSRRRGT